jgi:predicted Zn-dependent protease
MRSVKGHLAVNPPSRSSLTARPLVTIVLLLLLAGTVPLVNRQVARTLSAQGHLYRGVEAMNAGRADEAERAWNEALRAAPENPNAWRALGGLYISQGRLAEARDLLRRLSDRAPGEEHTLCELAEVEFKQGNPDSVRAAAEDAARAARLEPACFRAHTVAGNAWLLLGDAARGLHHLRAAARLNPSDTPLVQQLIRGLLEGQQLPEATRRAEALTARYPGFAQGYALLAVCYQLHPPDTPRARKALETARRCIDLDPTNALGQAQVGRLMLRDGDRQAAVRHLEAARFLNPERTATLFDLARAYRVTGRRAEAEAVQTLFRTRSALENELAALAKQLVMDPANNRLAARKATVSRML